MSPTGGPGHRGLVVLIVLVGLALSGCDSDSADPEIAGVAVADARIPDDEGVLTEVGDDFSSVTIDGSRRYRLADGFGSILAATGEATPLLGAVDNYVQVGVDDERVTWLASVSPVVGRDGRDTAYHSGVVAGSVDDRVRFADGTTLRLGPDTDLPAEGSFATAEIDVQTRAVRVFLA